MLYRPTIQTATPTAPVVLRVNTEAPRISGHKVAHHVAGKSQAGRAADAADLYSRGFMLQKPTIKQWAAICGVSAASVHAALKLAPVERSRVRTGLRPLIETKAAGPVQPASPSSKALADAWTNSTTAEREMFIKAVGVGAVWDTIEKVIA